MDGRKPGQLEMTADDHRANADVPARASKQDVFDEGISSADISDSRQLEVEAAVLRLPEFWHAMLSTPLQPEVRDQIVTIVNREFSRSVRSPASTMVRELNQALRDARVSAEDAQATMGDVALAPITWIYPLN